MSASEIATVVYGPNTVRNGSTFGDQDHTQDACDSHHLMVTSRTPANFGSTASPVPVTTMVYDASQRVTLTSTTTGSGTASFAYDGDGLRTTVTTAGTTVHDTWDRQSSLPVLIDDGITAYIYGPSDLPVEQVGSSGTQWCFGDAQGSTITLTDSTGGVGGTCAYDTWGRTTTHTGTDTSLQYDGQITDTLTGLIYLRARYYDPTTAQFLSVDPLVARTLAAYLYAGNNPLNRSEPVGLFAWGALLGASSTVTGIAAVVMVALAPESAATTLAVAAVLEGLSIATSMAATAVDCSQARNGVCAVDAAATALGATGGAVRVLCAFGRVAKPVAEATDTVLGTWGAHVGFAGTVAGIAEACGGDD